MSFLRPARSLVVNTVRPKTTYIYPIDKTFSQKWVEKRVKKINQMQDHLSLHDGNPIWWKYKSDRALMVGMFAITGFLVLSSLKNAFEYANGTLKK